MMSDFFLGLNAIRALSVIAMLLVFSSSIFVLVKDIEAVNNFTKTATDADYADCDYIEYVASPVISQDDSHFRFQE